MKRANRSLLLGLTIIVSAAPVFADDADEIREAFTAYRSAVLAGDGDSAAALLSQSTFDYYDEMRRLALFGTADTVQAQSLVNQMQVLIIRLRVPADVLESLSPEGLIAHAVDQGWIGKNSVLNIQPGEVLSEGDVGVLHAIVGGEDIRAEFRFNRESGNWRLDLVPTIQAANVALQLAAQQAGISEDAFMLVLMESALGQKVGDEAWIPPRASER